MGRWLVLFLAGCFSRRADLRVPSANLLVMMEQTRWSNYCRCLSGEVTSGQVRLGSASSHVHRPVSLYASMHIGYDARTPGRVGREGRRGKKRKEREKEEGEGKRGSRGRKGEGGREGGVQRRRRGGRKREGEGVKERERRTDLIASVQTTYNIIEK